MTSRILDNMPTRIRERAASVRVCQICGQEFQFEHNGKEKTCLACDPDKKLSKQSIVVVLSLANLWGIQYGFTGEGREELLAPRRRRGGRPRKRKA